MSRTDHPHRFILRHDIIAHVIGIFQVAESKRCAAPHPHATALRWTRENFSPSHQQVAILINYPIAGPNRRFRLISLQRTGYHYIPMPNYIFSQVREYEIETRYK